MISFGAVNRQNATGFDPADGAIANHFEAQRAHAQIAGVVDQRMIGEIVQRLRVAKAGEILRTGAVDLRELAQRSRNQPGIFQRTDANHTIKTLADYVNQPVAAAELQFDAGILLQKCRQLRNNQFFATATGISTRRRPLMLEGSS